MNSEVKVTSSRLLAFLLILLVLIFISNYLGYNSYSFFPFETEENEFTGEILLEPINNTLDIGSTEIMSKVYAATEQSTFNLTPGDYLDLVDTVILQEEFRKLIDPNAFSCSFSKDLKKKFKDKKGWIPEEIYAGIKDSVELNRKVLKYKESSAANVFNLVDIIYQKGTKDTVVSIVPEGSMFFNNESIFYFLNNQKNSFIVNFDCDTYYKAAINAGLGGNKKKIRAEANASRGINKSAFVGLGYVYSPFLYVMEPASVNINKDKPIENFKKFSHLASLLAKARIIGAENFNLRPIETLKMVWTSNTGSNNLNSSASLSGSYDGSVINASGSIGIKVKKSASYNNFNSYLIGKEEAILPSYDKTEVSKKMSNIFESIEFEIVPYWDNKDLVFSIKVNEGYCSKIDNEWNIKEQGFKLDDTKVIKNNECKFIIDGDINTSIKRITLEGKVEEQAVSRVINLPILD